MQYGGHAAVSVVTKRDYGAGGALAYEFTAARPE